MKAQSFHPSLASELREDAVVMAMMILAVPVLLYLRSWSHPSFTWRFALITGLVGGVLTFAFYVLRFLIRAPRDLLLSDIGIVLTLRNGTKREIRWDDIREAVLKTRWGARWQLQVGDTTMVVSGDGFSNKVWHEINEIVIDNIVDRGKPVAVYDAQDKCVSEYKGERS